MSSTEELSLNNTLYTAVLEIIDFYSKKGVFKINEYKDIATITERLNEVKTAFEKNDHDVKLTLQEVAFIIQIFREGTQRIPTAIDGFGQLFAIYQHFVKYLEQENKKAKEAEESSKLPTVEELEE
jgi:hypothetical protein